jgi:hypothetical protein
VDDLVEATTDLLLRKPQDDAVNVDVLSPAELRVKACPELDEGGDASSRDAITRTRVLLPEPFRPTIPRVSPAPTATFTSVRASTNSSGRESFENARVSDVLKVV